MKYSKYAHWKLRRRGVVSKELAKSLRPFCGLMWFVFFGSKKRMLWCVRAVGGGRGETEWWDEEKIKFSRFPIQGYFGFSLG